MIKSTLCGAKSKLSSAEFSYKEIFLWLKNGFEFDFCFCRFALSVRLVRLKFKGFACAVCFENALLIASLKISLIISHFA